MGRKKTGNLLLFLLCLAAFPVWSQKVELSTTETAVAPNDPIILTVSSTVRGTVKIDFPLEFSPEYGSSTTTGTVLDPKTGKMITRYSVEQRGSFRKKGQYSFYAFVQYRGRTIQSNRITIKVSDNPARQNAPQTNDPVYGFIKMNKTSVYEGEPILLTARVHSRLDIFHMAGYRAFKSDKNAEEHVFQDQIPDFRQATINGQKILVLEFDKQLLFPVTTGKCRISPFEMSLEYHDEFFNKEIRVKSAAAFLTVKPLPNGTPSNFIGAVGHFSLKQIPGKTTINQGEAFTLELQVEGRGNLQNINAPVLTLPAGCTVYGDARRKDDFVFTQDGVDGIVTFSYDIVITSTGKTRIPGAGISWFDPQLEQYQTATAPDIEVIVQGKAKSAAKGGKTKLIPKKQAQANKESGSGKLITGIVIAVITGLVVFVWIYLSRRSKAEAVQSSETGGDHDLKNTVLPVPPKTIETESREDHWQLAEESADDPGNFAILLPKAIIAEINLKTGKIHLTRAEALSAVTDSDERHLLESIIETCDQYHYGLASSGIDTRKLLSVASGILKKMN